MISSNNQGKSLAGRVLFEKQKSNDRFFLFKLCPASILQNHGNILLGSGSAGLGD
jgi:hypothetical protein